MHQLTNAKHLPFRRKIKWLKISNVFWDFQNFDKFFLRDIKQDNKFGGSNLDDW